MRLQSHRWLLAPLFLCLLGVFARAEETTAVAHIKLSGSMEEAPAGMDPFMGAASENFKTTLERILKAKKDVKIKALYLQVDDLAIGYGKAHELREAIKDFRKSGKKVYAFLGSGDLGGTGDMDYLVAAACDQVAMPESGSLGLTGVRFELTFFKDLFEKVGLKADMMQMGDFKGAGETFARSSASPENRKQWEAVVDDFYNYLVESIAESRSSKGFTTEKVKKLIDEGPFTARKALKVGLVDRLCYADEFQDAIKQDQKADKLMLEKNYGKKKGADLDFSNPFAIFKLLSPSKDGKLSSKPKVALIYASGSIVTGKGGESLFGGGSVGSTTMVEAIKKAEEEPTVKAIVLRVDSPGGSALASDLIWNELRKSKKPVVASMSDIAGSGGYYISMAAKKIYAEPGTITGSIGVVGGKIVTGGVFDRVGVTTEVISRGANAGALSSSAPFTDGERKAMKEMMQDIYDQFVDKTLQCRQRSGKQLTRDGLLKLAGGRIWTGRQAKENGLIDEIGTLDDAIAAAKEMAGMGKDDDVELLILPKARSFLDTLLESAGETSMPLPKGMSQPILNLLPEMSAHLRSVEMLLRLRGESVWAIIPYRMEVK